MAHEQHLLASKDEQVWNAAETAPYTILYHDYHLFDFWQFGEVPFGHGVEETAKFTESSEKEASSWLGTGCVSSNLEFTFLVAMGSRMTLVKSQMFESCTMLVY